MGVCLRVSATPLPPPPWTNSNKYLVWEFKTSTRNMRHKMEDLQTKLRFYPSAQQPSVLSPKGYFLPTAREGNVFRSVCKSFCLQGEGCLPTGGLPPGTVGGGLPREVSVSRKSVSESAWGWGGVFGQTPTRPPLEGSVSMGSLPKPW